jgi:hypothetical protein
MARPELERHARRGARPGDELVQPVVLGLGERVELPRCAVGVDAVHPGAEYMVQREGEPVEVDALVVPDR